MYDFSKAFDCRVFEEKSMELEKNCTNKNYKLRGKKFSEVLWKDSKERATKSGMVEATQIDT